MNTTAKAGYEVQQFDASGAPIWNRPAIKVDSLKEARAEARRMLGLSRLHPSRKGGCPDAPGLVGVESWCEKTAAQANGGYCGFVAISLIDPAHEGD